MSIINQQNTATAYLPVWQIVPEYPAGQKHWNLLTWFAQVPPFTHGLLAHSSISVKEEEIRKQIRDQCTNIRFKETHSFEISQTQKQIF